MQLKIEPFQYFIHRAVTSKTILLAQYPSNRVAYWKENKWVFFELEYYVSTYFPILVGSNFQLLKDTEDEYYIGKVLPQRFIEWNRKFLEALPLTLQEIRNLDGIEWSIPNIKTL